MKKEEFNGIFDTMKPNQAQVERMYRNITEPVEQRTSRQRQIFATLAPDEAAVKRTFRQSRAFVTSAPDEAAVKRTFHKRQAFVTSAPDEAAVKRTFHKRQIFATLAPDEAAAKRTFRLRRAFTPLAACVLCLVIGLTAYAAWVFLNPADVAEKMGESEIAQLFQGESAIEIGETAQSGEYEITLLGAAPSKEFKEFSGVNLGIIGPSWNVVVAVRRIDGEPVGAMDLYVNTFFKSNNGWENNYAAVNHGTVTEDGVLYLVASADAFGSYLVVSDAADVKSAFTYDEYSFAMTPKADYKGLSAVFNVEGKIALSFLSSPKERDEWLASEEYAEYQKDNDFYMSVPLDLCEQVPESVKIVKIEEMYEFDFGDGMRGILIQKESIADDNNFDEHGIFRQGWCENNDGEVFIIAVKRSGDDTALVSLYKAPKRQK